MGTDKRLNRWYFGGLSSAMAVCVTHPLDLIKVHLQTQQLPKKSLRQVIGHIYETEGFFSFYEGMTASLLRQLTYTTTRFGIYETGKQFIDTNSIGQTLTLASVAGVVGGAFGVPADLVNVRMQNDLKLPKEKRRGYKNVFDGLYRITKDEGFKSLYKGGSVAIFRGVVMTISQNVTYNKIKMSLLETGYFMDNSSTHFLTSFMSAATAALCSQPLDVMKTRLMNSKPGQYSGLLEVVKDISMVGPSGFFKGFIPAFARIGPHTILTFLMMEQLRLYFGYVPTKS